MAKANGNLGDIFKAIAKAAISANAPFLGAAILDRVLGEDDLADGLKKLLELGHRIDGKGNTLADAHVGPSDSFVLELRIDDAESFTEQKFEAAITHEAGHLIGLTHSNTPNQLMNTHVGAVTKPQAEDIELAKAMWGEPRFHVRKKKRKKLRR